MNKTQTFGAMLAGAALFLAGAGWHRLLIAPPAIDQASGPHAVGRAASARGTSDSTRSRSRAAAPVETAFTGDPEAYERAQGQPSSDAADAGRSKLESRYQAETVDAGWAIATERALESLQSSDLIEQAGARPVALDIACRSSVCRLQAGFASRTAADDWATLYLLNAGQQMSRSAFRRIDYQDGTSSVEMYGHAR